MEKTNFGKIKLGRLAVAVAICVLMLTAAVATTMGISIKIADKINVNSNKLSYTFLFKEPTFKSMIADNSEYTIIEIPGSITMAKTSGQPALPVHFATILLPPKTEVASIDVIGTQEYIDTSFINLNQKPVLPYQHSVPFGCTEPQEFEKDSILYSSNIAYPSNLNSEYSIGYSRGYAILNFGLYPIQYNPYKGTLVYYSEIEVTINLRNTDYVNEFFRNNPDDKAWVEKLVYNPNIADMYTSDLPTFDYPGGICDPSGHYDYVIITTTYNGLNYWATGGTLTYNWESLMNKHQADDGLSCTLVTVQDINACTDYHDSNPLFNDQQAHIREFCKDAYQDWETSYILIGADGESSYIPARDMKTAYESNIDADIYWSNLDNNFNANSNSYWGEEGDNGFDLYAELFIGRVTCDVPQDVSNWLTKVFYYADSTEDVYLDNAAFYGGDTGWSCQGDDFMDYSAIKGTNNWLGPDPGHDGPFPTWAGFQFGFETWNTVNVGNEFDLSVAWTAEPPNPGWQGGSETAAINGLKTAINNDQVTLMSGIAHADSTMSLDVYASAWESQYTNTKPFFLHDYGCHCGDFDASDDGVLHSMLFHSNTELAFGCVYNTCYGWGNLYCTNSSSAFQAKEFWSYFLDLENKSGDFGNWQLGKAQAYSKDRMAPTINWDYSYGTWRAIIQGCLLFGDPAQTIKSPHPSDPPAKPTAPNGPNLGILDTDYYFTSTTTEPDGENIFFLFDWGDGTNSGWLGPYASGSTATAIHSWDTIGEYDVKARAKDINGVQSQWSDPHTINIVPNQPPSVPTITGPNNIKPGVSYLFTFTSNDADGDLLYYDVNWGDGNSGLYGPYNPGQGAGISHNWATKGTYIIQARGKDVFGNYGEWAIFTISVTSELVGSQNNPMLQVLLKKLINQ